MIASRLVARPDLLLIPNPSSPLDRAMEVRKLRKHMILRSLRRRGSMSRMDLCRVLEFNYRSASLMVDSLIEEGLVEEGPPVIPQRGRPPIRLKLIKDAAMAIGLEFNRSDCRALMMNWTGRHLASVRLNADWPATSDERFALAERLLDKLLASASGPVPPLVGIGVSLPESVEAPPSPLALPAPATGPQTQADELRHHLENLTGAPAILDARARQMAIGSFWFGAGQHYSSFGWLNIGESPAVGFVSDGHALTGTHGLAGQAQYLACFPALGALDTDEGAQKMACTLAHIAVFYDPQAILLGGRSLRELAPIVTRVREAYQREGLPPRLASTPIHACDLGEDAGVLGAAATVLHHIFYSSHLTLDAVL